MSRTKAINDKCKDCIYDPLDHGTWREQVENCKSEKTCALWPYRPITTETLRLQRKGKTDADIDAIVDGLEDEE